MSEKIIASFLNKFGMPVILRNVGGFNWGFFSEEDRMHIQVIADIENYKIWLERKGVRVFEPANKIPSKVFLEIRKKVDEKREGIERLWIGLMIRKDWVSYSIDQKEGIAKIIVYPKTHNSFSRMIDLKKHTNNPKDYSIGNVKIDAETASLVLDAKKDETHWTMINLSKILFVDY